MLTTNETIITTPFGALQGTENEGVRAFRRVPYAVPAIGERRFRLPGEPLHWGGIRDATKPGPVPPQLPSRLDAVMGTYAMALDEDCLHLDIWSPGASDAAVPVLVFIHGGAFMTGGGSLACYDGELLARNTGCVIVNITYRLGPLGFLSQPGFAPANLGIHDQIAALRWIGHAIDAFGGNSREITVCGQSAGGFSIAALLANPTCKGLFKRAILMSAPLGLKLRNAEESPPVARGILDVLGYDPADLEPLRAIPPERILEALRLLQKRPIASPVPGDVTPPFMPVIDGDLITRDPIEAIREGAGAWCETIIGLTREEFSAFKFENPLYAGFTMEQLEAEFKRVFGDDAEKALAKAMSRRAPAHPGEILADLRSDEAFTVKSAEFAAAQFRHGGVSYMYQFDWQSLQPGLGACHCIDLSFLFGNVETWREAGSASVAGADLDELRDLSRIFQSTLTAFARTGSPESEGLPRWPHYGENGTKLHFDRRVQAYASI